LAEEQLTENLAYLCEIQAEVKNLKSLKIIEQFEFSSQKIGVSVSPIAEKYMDNIQEIGNQFNYLLNSTLYILDHSQIEKDKNRYFNISGVINEPKPNFEKIELNLSAITEFEKEKMKVELNCSIFDIINNNYTLRCKGDENITYNLKNGMSIIENEILLISFDNNANSTIIFETSTKEKSYRKYFYSRSNGNLNTGAIIAIILGILEAIVALVVAYVCINKGKLKDGDHTESTIIQLNK